MNELDLELAVNRVSAPWDSVDQYLEAHYGLLREEAITPLRNAVASVRQFPETMEKDSDQNACIYEKVGLPPPSRRFVWKFSLQGTDHVRTQVHIVGFTFANTGIATKVTFSTRRIGKKIIWEQSKRLLTGTLVALTPVRDMFKKVCKVAVVASRALGGVLLNPPELELFFRSPEDLGIDPQQEWVMVEANSGYFEAYRHTLQVLKKLKTERLETSPCPWQC